MNERVEMTERRHHVLLGLGFGHDSLRRQHIDGTRGISASIPIDATRHRTHLMPSLPLDVWQK